MGKIKEELQNILKQDQIEQMEKIKNIQDDTDKAIKSSDLLISTLVEKIQNLEASDKTNKQTVLNLETSIGDSNSKLSNLESADLYLQESYRILTEKSTTIEKDLKQMEQTVKKTISEQRTEMESRLKLDNGHLLEEMNNLMSSINGNANRISGVEESLKSSADELSTKMTNDLQNLEKSSIGRLVDLETAIS